jgi:predicted dinucleotide-binding enzyme
MRIAIIGAGNVGGGLGQALAAAGHDVVFGVRDPESVKTQVALAEIPDAVAVRRLEARRMTSPTCSPGRGSSRRSTRPATRT